MIGAINGETYHKRFAPVEHIFRYPVYYWAFDLDQIATEAAALPLVSYNSFSIFSINDRDYLDDTQRSIKEKLLSRVPEDIKQKTIRIKLVTTPRYFGFAFNPVSFYYLYDSADKLLAIAFEIHNTFSERHLYLMEAGSDGVAKKLTEKRFYVSPFNPAAGEYLCDFAPLNGKLKAHFQLIEGDKKVMDAGVYGPVVPLSRFGVFRDALLVGPRILLTLPRITWEAAKMYYGAKLAVEPKPNPTPGRTISTLKPTFIEAKCIKLFEAVLTKLSVGRVSFIYPNGVERLFGSGKLEARVEIYSYAFFVKVVTRGDVGLGEAYTAGLYRCDNLTQFLKLLVRNREALSHGSFFAAKLGKLFFKLQHLLRKNSITGSRKNISAHYDLSNDLFKLFLDQTLSYSSAYFKDKTESLEQAQLNKIDRLLEKAKVKSGDRVLEIGSGWGGLAIRAAQTTGCFVTTITLSAEQKEEAEKRIAAAGLSDKIEVLFCDYRQVTGQYDKIVSVEMLEAVGHQYYGDFFQTLEARLKPNGIVALQVITLPDQRFEEAKAGDDWIQQYIFPGSTIPSLSALLEAMKSRSTLVTESVENIAPHYAKTLRLWREAFLAKKQEIAMLGFNEEFIRAWDYYFSYCEAGFGQRVLSDLQLVLTRPQNEQLLEKDQRDVE